MQEISQRDLPRSLPTTVTIPEMLFKLCRSSDRKGLPNMAWRARERLLESTAAGNRSTYICSQAPNGTIASNAVKRSAIQLAVYCSSAYDAGWISPVIISVITSDAEATHVISHSAVRAKRHVTTTQYLPQKTAISNPSTARHLISIPTGSTTFPVHRTGIFPREKNPMSARGGEDVGGYIHMHTPALSSCSLASFYHRRGRPRFTEHHSTGR